MAKKKKKKESKKKFSYKAELMGIIYILIGVLGICGYGPCGEFICACSAFLFGCFYLFFLIGIILIGLYVILKKELPDFWNTKLIGLYLFVIGILMLLHMSYLKDGFSGFNNILEATFNNSMRVFDIVQGASRTLSFENIGGGIIGGFFISLFASLFDVEGVKIIYIVLIIFGVVIFTGISIADVVSNMLSRGKEMISHKDVDDEEEHVEKIKKHDVKINDHEEVEEEKEKVVISNINDLKKAPVVENKQNEEIEVIDAVKENENYQLPPVNLLDQPPKKTKNKNQEGIESNIVKLEEVLKEFGIIGHVVEVTVGPAITQYELELKAGTKLSKLTSINKEISLALAKKDVRIEAPIPGKSTVGIEISNESPTTVYVREIMEKLIAEKSSNKLMVALGKDILSRPMFCEINKTPHLLVAGATGSGKSVCINTIITSIIYNAKPSEVKLVMVDPKVVELSVYNGIPHLLIPVVTDPKKAAGALAWAVQEMDNRYNLFAEKGVRDLKGYNHAVEKDGEMGKLPQIVIIIDELADLMMVAAKEVEESICRLAQKARAAGMHLVIATQRPSVDVITGLIKANVPSRIAFAVSSQVDSRTILDQVGAEKLLGKGDMLFFPAGEAKPVRVQGAFVSDEEVESIVEFIKSNGTATYSEDILESIENSNKTDKEKALEAEQSAEDDADPFLQEAINTVVETGQASTSFIQRRFKVGYARAGRIIDQMEERGVISGYQGSKPREVLWTLEKLAELNMSGGNNSTQEE